MLYGIQVANEIVRVFADEDVAKAAIAHNKDRWQVHGPIALGKVRLSSIADPKSVSVVHIHRLDEHVVNVTVLHRAGRKTFFASVEAGREVWKRCKAHDVVVRYTH